MAKQLKILQWNSRSINANKYSLVNYISTHDIDVILLSETWLKENQTFTIKGFQCIRQDRHDGYGGVAILVSNLLNHIVIQLHDNPDTRVMACAVQITLSPPVDIMAIYKPPTVRVSFEEWSNLFRQCNTSNCIIGGDFNIHSTTWGCRDNNNYANDLINAVDEFDLILLNDGRGTCLTNTGNTTAIDLSFVSSNLAANCEWDVLDDTLGSNHYPIIIRPLQLCNLNKIIFPASRWNAKNVNWDDYSQQLESHFNSIEENMSAAAMYRHFLNKVSVVADSVMQIKKPFSPKHKRVCWWDNTCTNAIDKRKKVLQNYKQYPSSENFVLYKKTCAETKKLLKAKAKQSWKNFCEQLNKDTPPSKIWQSIRTIKHGKINKQTIPDSIIVEVLHNLCPDFVNFYNVKTNDDELEHVLSQPFTMEELGRILNGNTNTSPGFDNILYPMIKKFT